MHHRAPCSHCLISTAFLYAGPSHVRDKAHVSLKCGYTAGVTHA